MGHTHNPDQFQIDGKWFFNTGTWIPVVEASSAQLRRDNMFCFLCVRRNAAGGWQPEPLQHWNDDAGRGDPWVVVATR
jgi:hypothetical protein